VLAEFRFRELALVPMLTPYASFVLWCSPLITLPLLLRSERDLQIALYAVDFLGWLLAASVILPAVGVEFGEIQVSEGLGIRRVFGPLGDSVALLLSFFVVKAIANGRKIELLVLAPALLVTAGLGAMIVTLAALGLMGFLLVRTGKVQIRRSTLVRMLVLVPALMLALIIPAAGVMARLQSLESLQFTVASRIGSYQAAWAVFADNWLTGVGFTGLKAVVYRYEPETIFSLFSENLASTAQNQVLQTATDAGVIGVFVLIVFCILSLRQCYAAIGVAGVHQATFRAIFAWGVALCIANQTAVWLLPNSLVPFLFCLLVGLASLCVRVRPGAPTPG
jgi:O-antigen ligase